MNKRRRIKQEQNNEKKEMKTERNHQKQEPGQEDDLLRSEIQKGCTCNESRWVLEI